MKEIHFYLDVNFQYSFQTANPNAICCSCYDSTELAINKGIEEIHTTSLASITFDLLDLGYRIFLHRNNKVLECKPGMDGTEKDIRYEHNIFRIIRAKVFDDYFND